MAKKSKPKTGKAKLSKEIKRIDRICGYCHRNIDDPSFDGYCSNGNNCPYDFPKTY